MLGSLGAPLTEKFLVRRLSANLMTFTRSGFAPGIIAATWRMSFKSADHVAVWAEAGRQAHKTRTNATRAGILIAARPSTVVSVQKTYRQIHSLANKTGRRSLEVFASTDDER